MTFLETFSATSLTLFCAWIYHKFIEPYLDKGHKKGSKIVKKIWRKK